MCLLNFLFMRKIIFLNLLLLLIFNCNKKRQEKKNLIPTKEIKEEVYISLNDFPKSLSLNITNNKYQMKPDLLVISNKENLNKIVIPTDSIVDIVIGNRFYIAKAQFKKGDTVIITKKDLYTNRNVINYPFFTIKNTNLYELNFDFYVAKKTPTRNSFKIHKLNTRMDKRITEFTIDEVINNTLRIADSLSKENLISQKFYNKEIFELTYFKESFLLEDAFKKKKRNYQSNTKVPPRNLNSNSSYIDYLINKIKYDNFLEQKNSVRYFDVLRYQLMHSPFKSEKNIEYLVNDKLLNLIYNLEKKYLEESIEGVEKANQTKLSKKYRDILKIDEDDRNLKKRLNLSTGKFLEIKDSKEIIKTFEDIIEEEKGKLILIDFWASWCAPCRVEMPDLRKIKEEIDSSKLSIISVSIDDKISFWKKASKQEKLQHKNFLLLNHEKSEIIKNYKITTIPRYMIFDQNGILIFDDAPKPSSKELKEIIAKYLK